MKLRNGHEQKREGEEEARVINSRDVSRRNVRAIMKFRPLNRPSFFPSPTTTSPYEPRWRLLLPLWRSNRSIFFSLNIYQRENRISVQISRLKAFATWNIARSKLDVCSFREKAGPEEGDDFSRRKCREGRE